MPKTRITVATLGHLPAEFDRSKISRWQSSAFEISGDIESYTLNCDSDIDDWAFSDAALGQVIPNQFEGDFFVVITNVPLQWNWYTRRIGDNRIVFSFYEVRDILSYYQIPLENIVYRLLYAYTLIYCRNGSRVPEAEELTNFTHDETRGCIFDMNGNKVDIIHSCHEPIICPDCVERSRRERVTEETIQKCQKELARIKKPLFFRIGDFIRIHPIWALVISALSAITLGAIGSILGAFVYARFFQP